jgi:hypothetical protein
VVLIGQVSKSVAVGVGRNSDGTDRVDEVMFEQLAPSSEVIDLDAVPDNLLVLADLTG